MGQAFRRATGGIEATSYFDAPKTKPVNDWRIDPPRPADHGAIVPGTSVHSPSVPACFLDIFGASWRFLLCIGDIGNDPCLVGHWVSEAD